MKKVQLGIAKKTESWKLRSKFFPSKVGGKPSWLTLNKLPEPSELTCKTCGDPLVFLLQVYAYEDLPDTFHRSIYVFMCSNGTCYKKNSNENFIVFRSQLPRKNDFYSFDVPEGDTERSSILPSAEQYQNICHLCGCKAIMTCENCSKRSYCSDLHKRECECRLVDVVSMESNGSVSSNDHGADVETKKQQKIFLLPEFEIVSYKEYLPPKKPEKSEEEKMKEYQQYLESGKAPKEFQDMPLNDLDSVEKKNDKAFNKFKKRINMQDNKLQKQILRYQIGGNPLLISAEHVPTDADIPPCQCGAKRIFEFQIMPQLLIELKLDSTDDSPDWGTLLVYTCSKSCEAGTGAYAQEYLWKQDVSNNNIF